MQKAQQRNVILFNNEIQYSLKQPYDFYELQNRAMRRGLGMGMELEIT